MRIFSFKINDPVRVTRTTVQGVLIRVGGKYGVIETDDGRFLEIQLFRMRHLTPIGKRIYKKVYNVSKKYLPLGVVGLGFRFWFLF